jgi:hypothetical protein
MKSPRLLTALLVVACSGSALADISSDVSELDQRVLKSGLPQEGIHQIRAQLETVTHSFNSMYGSCEYRREMGLAAVDRIRSTINEFQGYFPREAARDLEDRNSLVRDYFEVTMRKQCEAVAAREKAAPERASVGRCTPEFQAVSDCTPDSPREDRSAKEAAAERASKSEPTRCYRAGHSCSEGGIHGIYDDSCRCRRVE